MSNYIPTDVDVAKVMTEVFSVWRRREPEPTFRIMTGAGGMDSIDAEFEWQGLGTRRLYVGLKVPRFLRVLKSPICKDRRGRWYKRVKP